MSFGAMRSLANGLALVLHGGALGGVLQELQQKWLQHVGAAVVRRQDVQQPPTPLAAFPATGKH